MRLSNVFFLLFFADARFTTDIGIIFVTVTPNASFRNFVEDMFPGSHGLNHVKRQIWFHFRFRAKTFVAQSFQFLRSQFLARRMFIHNIVSCNK